MEQNQEHIQDAHIVKRDIIQDFFESFDLKLFLYIAKRTLLFIIVLFLLSVLIPFLVIRYSTPIFETKATLIKKKEIKNSILDDKNTEFLKSNDEEKINRDIQLIKSDLLLDFLADSIGLNLSYYSKGRIPTKRFEMSGSSPFKVFNNYQIFNKSLFGKEFVVHLNDKNFDFSYELEGKSNEYKSIPYDHTFKNNDLAFSVQRSSKGVEESDYVFKFNEKESIKAYIQSNINVVAGAPNIHFSIKSSNSKQAEEILDKLLKGFLNLDQRENSEKVENSLKYIRNFVDTLNLQLDESQMEKANYVKSNSVYDPQFQLQSKLTEMEAYHQKIDELDAKMFSIQRLKSSMQSASTKKISSEDFVEDKELMGLINERNKLLIDYTPHHPTVTVINRQIKDKIDQVNSGLKNEISDYQNRIGQYRNRSSQAQSNLSSLPEKDMEFNKIQKEVEIKEKYVIDLIEKQIQYLIIKSSIGSDYLIIKSPKTDGEQIYPRKSMLYLTGIILFLLSTIGIVLWRYIKFDKIVSLDEVKKKTSIPILGYVPFVEEALDPNQANKNSPESRIVVLANPKSRTSEIFKKMRASLKYTTKSNYKTVASTSTISGEGKTFVLINLAAVHALLDKKVVIIDLDMRKPRIAKSFKISNKVGMSNLLSSDDISLDECIQQHPDIPTLDVIGSGPIPPNPSELIISDRFNLILDQLKERYDYIFIDTPPIGLVNESIEIINKVDVPLYLVKFNYSRKDFFNTMNDTNRLKSTTGNLYMIVNHFGEGASSYVNYDYGGYYGYGYAYGYGAKNYEYHQKHEGYYTSDDQPKEPTFVEKIKKFFDWSL